MKKALSFTLAVIILASALFIGLPMRVSAESLYIRKVVSVVYDDSGSMYGDKWAYANYAMQAFCGMLNSEDQLFITYMSDTQTQSNYDPESIDLSAGKIQGSVDSIRNHTHSGSTPYEAVEIAYNKLSEVDDSNPNTQYWLVVITDGNFDSKPSAEELNANFESYAGTTMPNGTKPQITFLAIGDDLISPDDNEDKGIYTFRSKGSGDIIKVMSEMADRISGRTRLEGSAIKQLDDRTIQVQSSIPLLNIAVLSQKTDAVITEAKYVSDAQIPVSRQAKLSYPGYSDLFGGAFLIGDSRTVIAKGTYNIRFDKSVDVKDIVVLFEPALEVRMTILLNGKEVSESELKKNAHAGDTITVSCKIYEMGTDNEVSPDLLPGGTTFNISITEDGKVVKQSSDKGMTLKDFVLGEGGLNTELSADVQIEGFNPIKYTVKFTPDPTPSVPPVPPVTYTITSEYGSGSQSVKYDHIGSNKDMTIEFTVLADGVPITDPDAVKALKPTITLSPDGNGGTTVISSDGKIVFTPNVASTPPVGADYFEVSVTCSIEAGEEDDVTPATAKYTVLVSEYLVIPVNADGFVRKTQFYGNQIGVSFYITKDGVRLNKQEVENLFTVLLDDKHTFLQMDVTVEADGTIVCVPYDENEYKFTFLSLKWCVNYIHYWGLEGSDVTITLSHTYGTASAVIPVKGETAAYMFKNVWAPLLLEVLLVTLIVAYAVRFVTKPKFDKDAVLYVGSISYAGKAKHSMDMREIRLAQFNKFKYLWNPFKELTVEKEIGISVTAAKGHKIICSGCFPWFCDSVRPVNRGIKIESPKDIAEYCQDNDYLTISEVRVTRVMDEQNPVVSQDASVYYFIRVIDGDDVGRKVIDSAEVFCYTSV